MSDADTSKPIAISAASAPLRTKPSNYPEPFFSRMAKREKGTARPQLSLFVATNFLRFTGPLPKKAAAAQRSQHRRDAFHKAAAEPKPLHTP